MLTPNFLPALSLLVSDNQGIYVPQRFIRNFDLTLWEGINKQDKAILFNGPDDISYWEAWETVLNNATFTSSGHVWRLHQDGDLWAYCLELMTDEEKTNFGFTDD